MADTVINHKTAVMQRVQDLVRRGYFYYTVDIIPKNKTPHLRTKLNAKYGCEADKAERQKRRRNGVGNSFLIIWSYQKDRYSRFFLIFDAKHEVAHSLETPYDAREKTSRIFTRETPSSENIDYELVRLDNKWTWRIHRECYERWQQRIKNSIRQPDSEQRRRDISQIVWSIKHMPGFRGIRQDAFKLNRYLIDEFRRSVSNKVKQPETCLPRPIRRVPHS